MNRHNKEFLKNRRFEKSVEMKKYFGREKSLKIQNIFFNYNFRNYLYCNLSLTTWGQVKMICPQKLNFSQLLILTVVAKSDLSFTFNEAVYLSGWECRNWISCKIERYRN